MSLPKAKTTNNTSMAIKSQSSQPKTITLLLAWSVMIKTSTILKLWMLPSLTLTVIALSPFSKQYVIEVMLALKRF
jgi:hypothetical protein